MGSHGGGTSEGQRSVLEGYGITEESMGVPIVAGIDAVLLGETTEGIPVYTDKAALDADMTVLINRIKPHTDFNGTIESGLCKMAVIGLGNHIGCTAMHRAGFDRFGELLPEAASIVLENSSIGFGLAIIENAEDRTADIQAVKSNEFLEKEPTLLRKAKRLMAKLRIPKMDVLIVEEIGKNISGAGIDPNVVGRFGPKSLNDDVPKYEMLVILDLSEDTHGNAVGIGFADVTTRAVLDKIDFESTYANSLASGNFACAAIPPALDGEREAIAAAVKLWGGDPEQCRIVRIRSTLNVGEILVSETLLSHIDAHPDQFEIIGRAARIW
jgi:hypothetical protein